MFVAYTYTARTSDSGKFSMAVVNAGVNYVNTTAVTEQTV